MHVKAVIVFDPSQKPPAPIGGMSEEEALAEARLLYYYASVHVEPQDRRSQSSLIQGVVEFTKFVRQSDPVGDETEPLYIETDQLLYLVTPMTDSEGKIFLAIIFDRAMIRSKKYAKMILQRFQTYYHLFHGNVESQMKAGFSLGMTMDDFVPSFISAETQLSSSIKMAPIAIRYAPVGAHALVAVHSLGLELLTEFQPTISGFAILYRGFLVSSSVEAHSLVALYSYLALNTMSGDVSNTKLLRPPYGRIGTAAIAPGGGSSAFGRCNFFDAENSSHGFLFGPTGSGEAVFSPQIFFPSEKGSRYLVAYIINGVMVIVFTRESPEFTFLKRLEAYLTDNSEFSEETLSLLRTDFAKAVETSGSTDEKFNVVYFNNQTKSMIPFDSSSSQGKDFKRSASLFAARFLTPFGSRIIQEGSQGEDVAANIDMLIDENPDIANVSVKASSNDGWKVFIRRGKDREIRFDFKDSKVPLWKVNSEISHFLNVRFDSVAL